jgi:LAO/AO transport system kinase
MDAAGRDLVLVETVGVGQDEVDVMRIAHTVVVVSVPGLGDDIQTLKAGILEIADIHAVNKADREGADRTMGELQAMLGLQAAHAEGWAPPVLACAATREEGIEPLLEACLGHRAALAASGELERRRERIAEARVLRIAQDLVAEVVVRPNGTQASRLIALVARRELAPHACARTLLAGAAGAERSPDV